MLSGQIPTRQHRQGHRPAARGQRPARRITPITKWRKRVLEVADIPAAVREAVRPAPVGPAAPGRDRDAARDDGGRGPTPSCCPPRGPPARGAPRATWTAPPRLLLGARAPLIYAGGGVHLSGAHDALAAVAEHLQAGVAQSPEGKGAVSDHKRPRRSAPPTGATRRCAITLHEADVVLAVGTRLALVTFKPGTRIVQIDADERGDRAQPHGHARPRRRRAGHARGPARAAARRRAAPGLAQGGARGAAREGRGQQHEGAQRSIIKALRAGTPENAILVAGMTQIGYYSRPFWPVYEPRTYLTLVVLRQPRLRATRWPSAPRSPSPDRAGRLGLGRRRLPLQRAGALHRRPPQINVVAVVFNDNAYGNVARDLDESWGGQYGAELHNPDFMKLADAYGVLGMRAKEPTEVGRLRGRHPDGPPRADRGAGQPDAAPGLLAPAQAADQIPALSTTSQPGKSGGDGRPTDRGSGRSVATAEGVLALLGGIVDITAVAGELRRV